jgi:hypothetical protein
MLTKSKTILTLGALFITMLAQADDTRALTDRDLPRDGSHCDPTVIAANLKTLRKADVLVVTTLTETRIKITGQCYNLPCPGEVEADVAKHCAKAEQLAEIVALLK